MSEQPAANGPDRQASLFALADELRPELHRYCSRLMGSVIDGEDVVQDTWERALAALPALDASTPLRPWLFRIAHNRALDLLRGRSIRATQSIDDAPDLPDLVNPDPMETLMRHQTVKTAVSRFAQLPVLQRSVVILKDVMDESLADIAVLLGITVDAVKAHLARGRARLAALNLQPAEPAAAPSPSPEALRYAALFNMRNWDGLRDLLADDVRLVQSAYAPRQGRADVGMFFTIYAAVEDVWMTPAWLEGREVLAVFERQGDAAPAYVMWLEWRRGEISFIRDYRHVPYVTVNAELQFSAAPAPSASPATAPHAAPSPHPHPAPAGR